MGQSTNFNQIFLNLKFGDEHEVSVLTIHHFYQISFSVANGELDVKTLYLTWPSAESFPEITNLFGDILSDEASALVGGLGLAPSANIGDKYSLFEPVHGSAPKYAGKDIVNPTAMLRATAMMLEHLNYQKEAQRLQDAILNSYKNNIKTKDVGGTAGTSQVIDSIISYLKD